MDDFSFRRANISEIPQIWTIIQHAIKMRKQDGSDQWQDGYPNPAVLRKDIKNGAGYVLTTGNKIVGYCAILINDEPEYGKIEGSWLTNGDFVVFHRVAIAENYLGKGLAQKIFGYIEQYALSKNVHSVKADTNFDNPAMIKIFEKLGYAYCGEVYFRGSPRRAYEKVLV